MIFIKYKYICWIFKKMRTYAAALTPPLPPCTQCVRIGLDPPPSPPSVRTYFMDDPLGKSIDLHVFIKHNLRKS